MVDDLQVPSGDPNAKSINDVIEKLLTIGTIKDLI